MKNKILAALAVSAVTFAFASEYVNPEIWFDGTDEVMWISTPNPENLSYDPEIPGSYWYDLDDRKNDHGGSYIEYPYDTLGYYGSLIAPMIDSLGYLAVKYHLVDPTVTGQQEEYPYNFVVLGFNTGAYGVDPLDISNTGGLCATYTSDIDITLEIKDTVSGFTHSDDPVINQASCYVTLKKQTEPTTVNKEIGEFKQPTWAPEEKKLASCEEAFKNAFAIWFKLDGGASEAVGELRIFEVGPLGTCKGGRSIADECWSYCKSDGEGHAYCRGGGCVESLQRSVLAASRSVSVNGRIVSLNGFGSSVSYRLFDLQGNEVRSGYAAGSIDFGGVKSGNYVLKVGGTAGLTKKILLK